MDLAAGEVATSLAWVAVEAARFRDAEDLAVISLRHRGLMAAVRPSVFDHGMQDGSPSRARLEAWGAREAAAMFIGAGPWGPGGEGIWAVVVEKAAHLGEVLAVRARALSARGYMTQAELCLERGLQVAPRNAFLVHQLAAFLVGVRADAPAAEATTAVWAHSCLVSSTSLRSSQPEQSPSGLHFPSDGQYSMPLVAPAYALSPAFIRVIRSPPIMTV